MDGEELGTISVEDRLAADETVGNAMGDDDEDVADCEVDICDDVDDLGVMGADDNE